MDLEIVPEEKCVPSCADFIPEWPAHNRKGGFSMKTVLFYLILFQYSINSFLVLFPSSHQESTFSWFVYNWSFIFPTASTKGSRQHTVSVMFEWEMNVAISVGNRKQGSDGESACAQLLVLLALLGVRVKPSDILLGSHGKGVTELVM